MQTVVRNVRDLTESDRSAVEKLVGTTMREDQQLIIQLVDAETPYASPSDSDPLETPEWWNVYAGLSDEEIEELDRAIRQRANLTRSFE